MTKEKKTTTKKETIVYGIAWLAKKLGVDERAVRVKLRTAEIAKDGKSYDFKTAEKAERVLKQLQPKEKKAA